MAADRERERGDGSDGPRLLVATGAAAAGVDEIPLSVRRLMDAAAEILVITPILPGGLQWFVSDTDRARHQADERLTAVLGHMSEMGLQAEGRVGDETPMTAFADAIDSFRPDHLVIALRGANDSGWQERRLVERLLDRFTLPITVFVIGGPGS